MAMTRTLYEPSRLLESYNQIIMFALRILDYIGRPYAVSGHSVTISASVGFAIAPEDGFDTASLFYGADLALHQAEKGGTNVYHADARGGRYCAPADAACRIVPSSQRSSRVVALVSAAPAIT